VVDNQEEHVLLRVRHGATGAWTVEVLFDRSGTMYLASGWRGFCRIHQSRVMQFLVFSHPRVAAGGNPNSTAATPSPPLSPPPAATRGRGRSKPGCCRRRRGLLVPSRVRDGAGCLLHGVGMVRPPGTMAWLLSGVRRREPRRSGAVATWRTAWRLGDAEEAGKVVEKAGGGGVACPSWQPRCIS
jgi:hypothetical protein